LEIAKLNASIHATGSEFPIFSNPRTSPGKKFWK